MLIRQSFPYRFLATKHLWYFAWYFAAKHKRCLAPKYLAKHLRYFARYFGAIYLRYLEEKYLAKYLKCFARCLDWCFGPK
jgi:hypothetical protein